LRYSWLERDAKDDKLGDYGAIKALRYWPEDFARETRFCGPRRVVHMQAAIGSVDPVEETRWLQRFADSCGIPNGIVGYVDLAGRNVEDVLSRHVAFPNFRGVRDLRHDNYFDNEAWRHGYRALEKFGLVCCDATPLTFMRTAASFVAEVPGVVYCVDHAGYPERRDSEYFHMWKTEMGRLAQVENTIVKISALGTYDPEWTIESLRPWVVACIDAWGPSRVVFGTNWPVDRLFSSYCDVVDAYRAIVSDFDLSEQAAMLSDNADRIFRLDAKGVEENIDYE
jgi:predicted TIM-barrel fold metal-dependent hydrolase